MTEGNYSSVWENDLCYSLSKTNLPNGIDMKESTYWINLRPMYCNENNSKKAKIKDHLYLLQENKSNFF